MRDYYKEIDKDGQMFDFKTFYLETARLLPNRCRVVEVGLNNGKSAIYLAEQFINIGTSVDRFIGVDNCAYGGIDQRNDIIKNIIKAEVDIEFFEMSSLDASCKFPGNYFHFVFLDSSHLYNQTRAEIILWYDKIMDDGILAGHDYYGHEEVRRAVDELIPSEHLHIEQTSNGYGIWWLKKNYQWKINY